MCHIICGKLQCVHDFTMSYFSYAWENNISERFQHVYLKTTMADEDNILMKKKIDEKHSEYAFFGKMLSRQK